jgi:Fur family ferric uptake transcriptional regulator
MNTTQKEQILQKLRDSGCRITKQRQILLDIILEKEYTCCKEIYFKALEQDETIGMATVYRMISTLEEIGALNRKNSYQVMWDECSDESAACVITFEDGSSMEMSAPKWNEVVKRGLGECGYLNGRELRNVRVFSSECSYCCENDKNSR